MPLPLAFLPKMRRHICRANTSTCGLVEPVLLSQMSPLLRLQKKLISEHLHNKLVELFFVKFHDIFYLFSSSMQAGIGGRLVGPRWFLCSIAQRNTVFVAVWVSQNTGSVAMVTGGIFLHFMPIIHKNFQEFSTQVTTKILRVL